MGEKEGKGEEKPKKTEGGGGVPNTVVLKMDLHCEGCALKVKRSVKRFDGVESVSVDIAGNKLTLVGKVDPVLLRERVEEKIRKKVELVSPAGGAAKPKDSGGGTLKPAAGGDTKKPSVPASSAVDGGAAKKGKNPAEEKIAKTPEDSTIVPKIRVHREGWINRIRKTIYKIKGVDDISLNTNKDRVIVKGTVDLKILSSILRDKLKQGIEVNPLRKEDGGRNKKDENMKKKESDDDEKKKDDKSGEKKKDGEDKKKNDDEKKKIDGSNNNNVKKEVDETLPTMTMNKMEYYGSHEHPFEITPSSYEYQVEIGSTSYGYESEFAQEQHPHRYSVNMAQMSLGYGVDLAHAPQMFSDENPNACSII